MMTTMLGRPAALATAPAGDSSVLDGALGATAVSLTQLARDSPSSVAMVSQRRFIDPPESSPPDPYPEVITASPDRRALSDHESMHGEGRSDCERGVKEA